MLMSFSSDLVNVSLIFYMTQFDSSSFTNPEYELVAIHPEHFLPPRSVFVVYPSGTSSPHANYVQYVAARDRRLRESADPNSPHLPTYRNVTESRSKFNRLNVFLVVLNAENKFHEYLEMISQNPPTTPLPDDVLALMHLTIELVDLLYWKPVPTKGSPGEKLFTDLSEMDLEKRKAHGRLLMSVHGTLSSFFIFVTHPQSTEYVYIDRDRNPISGQFGSLTP
jgi:hypothetical protein